MITETQAGFEALVGRVVDGAYEIVYWLGADAIGDVYFARDATNGREVVVKFLSEGLLDDPQAVASFVREAESLAQTHHDNIVSLLDYGWDDGRVYTVTEYVGGTLLEHHVGARGGQLPIEEFVPIAAQILKAMGHAHSRAMMLRDIKPSNIMLYSRQGRANLVKILGLGLADPEDETVRVTRGGAASDYLAPEGLRGNLLDLRGDVYAAGVLFYRMLSGRMPDEDATSRNGFHTSNDRGAELASALSRRGVPQDLAALICDCLRYDPDDRPADADAIVERLIESVPSSMFRLPRANSLTRSPRTDDSTSFEVSPPPRPAPHTTPTKARAREGRQDPLGAKATAAKATAVAPARAPQPARPTIGFRRWQLAAIGLVTLVAAGVVVVLAWSPDAPEIREPQGLAISTRPAAISEPEAIQGDAHPSGSIAPNDAVVPQADQTATDDPILAAMEFESRPAAKLTIDGRVVGRTPYSAKLEIGRHAVQLSAKGRRTWRSTIEITEGTNAPLSIALDRVDSSKRSARTAPPSEGPRAAAQPSAPVAKRGGDPGMLSESSGRSNSPPVVASNPTASAASSNTPQKNDGGLLSADPDRGERGRRDALLPAAER